MYIRAGTETEAVVIQTLQIRSDGKAFPNSHLPVVVYRADKSLVNATENDVRRLLQSHCWYHSWTDVDLMRAWHFHATAHEVLIILRGWVEVHLGGPQIDRLVHVAAGEAVLIPAGVGHRRGKKSRQLVLMGGYPEGQQYDTRLGVPDELAETQRLVQQVPLPAQEPIEGLPMRTR